MVPLERMGAEHSALDRSDHSPDWRLFDRGLTMAIEYAPVMFFILCDDEPKTEVEAIEHNTVLEDEDAEILIRMLEDLE